jgi:hypothetical protein
MPPPAAPAATAAMGRGGWTVAGRDVKKPKHALTAADQLFDGVLLRAGYGYVVLVNDERLGGIMVSKASLCR